MKKRFIAFIASLLLISIVLGLQLNNLNPKKLAKSDLAIQPTQALSLSAAKPVLANAETPAYYPPKLLTIPKIGLQASILSLGLDSQGRMDVPHNFVDVGWYDLGYKPGQKGSAVLDGHYDDFHGHPAVFYHLYNLIKGDKIMVTDQLGKQYTYIVTDKEVYPYDNLPLRQIFTANDKARLNIITCHGQWDSIHQIYTQRAVIYAELQT